MVYIKIEDNIVVQKQPNKAKGFVKVSDDIICGMVHDGGESLAKTTFSNPPPENKTWDQVRNERNKRLASSDWTVLPDHPFGDNSNWIDYRQVLRDIPDDHAEAQEAYDTLESLEAP